MHTHAYIQYILTHTYSRSHYEYKLTHKLRIQIHTYITNAYLPSSGCVQILSYYSRLSYRYM